MPELTHNAAGNNTGNPFEDIEAEIFNITKAGFEGLALRIFQLQYEQNPLYRSYCKALHIDTKNIISLSQIPFLPIGFFKTHEVKTTAFEPEMVFDSSGTTGMTPSKHHVKNISLYKNSFEKCFESFYGSPAELCILGLLPSYMERKSSSLVYMTDDLIKKSGSEKSGFFLNRDEVMYETLMNNELQGIKTILLGVTYALLDFSEKYPMPLKHTIIMETGGMKGRRQEMLREEVHQQLKEKFQTNHIHSEYGMTELLSQAYSIKGGLFNSPAWMHICLRSEDSPLEVITKTETNNPAQGAVNIIDLANLYSCCFIATDDFGRLYQDGSFEITGRMDNSDLRGCSLMVS